MSNGGRSAFVGGLGLEGEEELIRISAASSDELGVLVMETERVPMGELTDVRPRGSRMAPSLREDQVRGEFVGGRCGSKSRGLGGPGRREFDKARRDFWGVVGGWYSGGRRSV